MFLECIQILSLVIYQNHVVVESRVLMNMILGGKVIM